MEKKIEPGHREGIIAVPASKSDAQRAYLCAALAKGVSVITGWGSSADEKAMLNAIRQLGAEISVSPQCELVIKGIDLFPSQAVLSAGESGLAIRLLAMVCAAHEGTFRIEGEGSLRMRTMEFLGQHLPFFCGKCSTTGGKVPLEITGPMFGAKAEIDGSLSSQFISGLLMSLPLVNGDSDLHVVNLKSTPYVEMTLHTLGKFGIRIEASRLAHFLIPGGQTYQPANYRVDADWSSASYWLVAAALGHDIAVAGLDRESRQADRALTGFLEAANCRVAETNDEMRVDGSARRSFSADATHCPDLFPALVALAAFCKGKSVITGVSRLAHKESHRALTLQSGFAKLGVRIDLDEDRMTVHGTGAVKGGTVSSHNDHRIAMCLAIAGLSAESALVIEGAEAVKKSYPSFWEHLEALKNTNRQSG